MEELKQQYMLLDKAQLELKIIELKSMLEEALDNKNHIEYDCVKLHLSIANNLYNLLNE